MERLKAAGCIVVGKTNTPELGHKGDTINPLFGATCNPWDLDAQRRRVVGRLGGGDRRRAGAAVHGLRRRRLDPHPVGGVRALRHEAVARPRARSGGPKPPGWADLSTKGPMARTVRDITLALDAVVGPEPTDLRSLPMPDASWTRSLDELARAAQGRLVADPRLRRGRRARCGRSARPRSRTLEGLGTEVVDVDPVFDEDPAHAVAHAGDGRQPARARTPPRAPTTGTQLDPDHVALIDAFGRQADRASTCWPPSTRATRANLRLVELFHQVPLLLTPTVGGQVGPAGEPRARSTARRPRSGWPSPTRST